MTTIISKTMAFFWVVIQRNVSLTRSKKVVFCTFSLLLFISCNKSENLSLTSLQTPTGWGYCISNNEKLIIKQTIIPVISKNKSFRTENDALKVGNLVVSKMKKGLSPTVTKKDLFLLQVKI